MKKKIIIGVIVLFIVMLVIGSMGGDSNTPTKNDSETTSNSQIEESEHAQTVEADYDTSLPHFEDGTHSVGADIQPGTYRTREASSGCYYARLSGFGGTLDEILSNNNTNSPTVVTISEGDKGFESNRCGIWTQDLSQITDSMTTFTDGTYIVGTDIQAGTYKNSGQSGCYYARLSGFSGDLGDIISNNNTDTSTIVTIAATDAGFTANRCGTWTLQE